MNNIYKIIDDTMTAYYLTNEDVLTNEQKSRLEVAQHHTMMWSRDEAQYNWAYTILSKFDKYLAKKLKCMWDYPMRIQAMDSIYQLVEELVAIDDTLSYYERLDLGFGPDARSYRKRWRTVLRKLDRTMNKRIRNHLKYLKKWSKPRQEYIMLGTGEVHNGIGQAICDLIRHPGLIKYGIEKMKED